MLLLLSIKISLIFSCLISLLCSETIVESSKEIEKLLSERIQVSYHQKISDFFFLSFHDISPVLTYKKKKISTSPKEKIVYKQLLISFFFKLNISYENDQAEALKILRDNLSVSLLFKKLTLLKTKNDSFIILYPLTGVVDLDFADLPEFKLLHESLFEKRFDYKEFFMEVFTNHLESVLSRVPKNKIKYNFESFTQFIEMLPSFNLQCCQKEKIFMASISDISYTAMRKLSSHSGIFKEVEMVVCYWKEGEEHRIRTDIDNLIFTRHTIMYGNFSPADSTVKGIIIEIFNSMIEVFNWEE